MSVVVLFKSFPSSCYNIKLSTITTTKLLTRNVHFPLQISAFSEMVLIGQTTSAILFVGVLAINKCSVRDGPVNELM